MDDFIETWLKKCSYSKAVMCSISLYGWCRCSLYDTPSTECVVVYNTNCSLFVLFLCWDMYTFIKSTQTMNDILIVHHIFSIIGIILNFSLQTSHTMISLSMTLMDYVLMKQYMQLALYRSLCILIIRIPLATYFMLLYNPTTISYYAVNMNNAPYSICFILYDIYILYNTWKRYIPYIRSIIQCKLHIRQS